VSADSPEGSVTAASPLPLRLRQLAKRWRASFARDDSDASEKEGHPSSNPVARNVWAIRSYQWFEDREVGRRIMASTRRCGGYAPEEDSE
jgi:hypothetical protein